MKRSEMDRSDMMDLFCAAISAFAEDPEMLKDEPMQIKRGPLNLLYFRKVTKPSARKHCLKTLAKLRDELNLIIEEHSTVSSG